MPVLKNLCLACNKKLTKTNCPSDVFKRHHGLCNDCYKPWVKSTTPNGLNTNERERQRRLMRLYGMTLDQYDQMLYIQRNTCAICHIYQPGKAFDVDHSHHNGKIRGLLCPKCNYYLGIYERAFNKLPETLKQLYPSYPTWYASYHSKASLYLAVSTSDFVIFNEEDEEARLAPPPLRVKAS